MTTRPHIFDSQLADLEPSTAQVRNFGLDRRYWAVLKVGGRQVWKSDIGFRNRDESTSKNPSARDVATLVWFYVVGGQQAPNYLLNRLERFKVRGERLANGESEWTPLVDWCRNVADELTQK